MRTGVVDVRAIGPLIHLRLEGSAPSIAHEAAREELTKLVERGGRFGVVVDLREASPRLRLEDQRAIVDFLVRHRATMARDCAGVAIVLRGRVTKAALRAIVRFAPSPVAVDTFAHAMAAEAWLRERLGAASGAASAVGGER